MAETFIRYLVDDLDGDPITDNAQRVEFSFRGIDYRIDLRQSNADTFESVMTPFIDAADAATNRQKNPRHARRSQCTHPPDPEAFSRCDIGLWRTRFEAMADPNRLRILHCLSTGPMRVTDLALATGMTVTAISHAVRKLRDRKIVSRTKNGRNMHYQLDDTSVRTLLHRQRAAATNDSLF
ncbi:metalloregulator ArsR/SmtB family transcription factor [Rhodococcus qingshengii]|uniref:metalloregulator ArsR/SmtB family transcription factor n=1 Tax=Rhodococcus qingshengii TaxID=334542 RepID=UPI001E4C0DD6|nr:metalloregulator ArsR/SmtB family transcription factor [Rhodococcus qingshengii]MCD2136196.1 metalloregulator ArsR/SmtB family transcription factor [Rhodococcus qingshengii]UGQ55188.1 metalloregulator ArsR/SmtB family transcription factor [Rhodococcus qingshengii]